MTNKRTWLRILVMLMVFGIVIVGCDNGTTELPITDPPVPVPQAVIHVGMADNDLYTLSISGVTNNSIYTPKSGDSYELTVYSSGLKKSSGTVVVVFGENYSLKPSNSDTIFTAKITASGYYL